MCDTLVAVGNSTDDGSVVIAKNSDREPNECQVIRYFPRRKHEVGSKVRCTHVEIPEEAETYEVVLSCPYWMWGAEMGANEYGVAIGNESAWSKEPIAKTGLIGMDLLRIALERSETARKALDLITHFLETLGQGGNCSPTGQLFYHNTFIIADPREAWVLETADRYWIAERVYDVRSISNGYTIGSKWDLASPGLVQHGIEKGWCRSKEEFNFTECYSDQEMRSAMSCIERSKTTMDSLREAKGRINVETMMRTLRNHGGKSESWAPHKAKVDNICWHSNPSVYSSTAGSYVGRLTEETATHWFSGGSYPCISAFVPVYLSGAGAPELLSKGGCIYDDSSYWWRHEMLARIVQLDYSSRAPPIQREAERLERTFMEEDSKVRQQIVKLSRTGSAKLLHRLTEKCCETVHAATADWIQASAKIGSSESAPISYRNYWNRYNVKAKLQL